MIITRNGGQSVVMLSHEDVKSLEEAAYLPHDPANGQQKEALLIARPRYHY